MITVIEKNTPKTLLIPKQIIDLGTANAKKSKRSLKAELELLLELGAKAQYGDAYTEDS